MRKKEITIGDILGCPVAYEEIKCSMTDDDDPPIGNNQGDPDEEEEPPGGN